jgi:hypothetical protein
VSMTRHAINPDFFRLEVPAIKGLSIPTVTINDTDNAITVDLFDESHDVIQSWPAIRKIDIQPPPSTTCYLKVDGVAETRYKIQVGMKVDKDSLPGPLQVDPFHLPKLWGDPPSFRVKDVEHYVTEINADSKEESSRHFQTQGGGVIVTLIGMDGKTLREGTNHVSTAGLNSGIYLIRLARTKESDSAVTVYQVPPILDGVSVPSEKRRRFRPR